jgi:hypothetical protein
MQLVAWIGLLLGLSKFNFHIHPSAVVLLVIDSVQSPCFSLPLMMSIQGIITAAKNLSKLFVA